MLRRPETPLEKILRRAQAQGTLDSAEGCRPKQMPQLLEALDVRVKLHPGELAMLKSMYQAGFNLSF